MNLDEIISQRRSIRTYQNKAVPDADLNAVLEAGRLAPSARNLQMWRFTAVRNAEMRQKLAGACCKQQMVAQAPVALVLWQTQQRIMSCGQSDATVNASIAMSFMMLKAVELGLSTCWLGAFEQEEVKEILKLPQDACVVVVSPLGYANEAPGPRPRKDFCDVVDIIE